MARRALIDRTKPHCRECDEPLSRGREREVGVCDDCLDVRFGRPRSLPLTDPAPRQPKGRRDRTLPF
jgi:hypothetical protein